MLDVDLLANLVGKTMSTYKTQLEYHKLIGAKPHLPELFAGEESDS